jgi:hypothetical protein
VYSKHQEKIIKKQNQAAYKDIKKDLEKLVETKVNTEHFYNQIYNKESFNIWYLYIGNKLKLKTTNNSTSIEGKTTKLQNSVNQSKDNYYQKLQPTEDITIEFSDNLTMTKLMNDNTPMEITKLKNKTIVCEEDDDITLLNETIELVKQQTAELLLTKTNVTPSREEMMEKLQTTNDQQTMDNYGTTEDGWKIQGMKSFKKEKNDTYEEVSEKYLPLNLPLFESEIYVDTPTKYIIPITINIRQPRNTQCCILSARLLVAMLKVLQIAYHDTYIGPLNPESTIEKLSHHKQVPMDNVGIRQYIMKPVMMQNNIHSTKIVIHANHELKDFLMDPTFRKYTKMEQITITRNILNTAVPFNVGYLEYATQSRDTIDLHQERLQNILPANAPAFQVNLVKIFGTDNKPTYMVMVQSDKVDANKLTTLLQEISKKNNIGYIPWEKYTELTLNKKQQVIKASRLWNNTFKSLVIDGFNDNDDNVPMLIKTRNSTETDEGNYLYTTSVSDYLRQLEHPTKKIQNSSTMYMQQYWGNESSLYQRTTTVTPKVIYQ